ncbi:N-acetyltransferase [Ancylobacter sonchi]|uniref:GNAT family N-acetyltransferase n=1 Tax=Ancylobacter sonchi TaxID=1937790 RepID=UPI001BD63FD5|nr:GNAT family N-acetyltransferase [Ancylobacter sonchi]MBS7537295.1 N-acetyltransferase [Ancylobacter sonchi]
MSMNGEIPVRDNRAKDRFEIEIDGHLAIAQYILAPDHIIFTHTEVPPELGGRGIATRLVEAGLASARERHLSVIPRCSVFGRYMIKHPETHGLMAPEIRATLGLPA